MALEFELVQIEKSEDLNVIIGQSHFIKTVEDLYEAMANAGGSIKFGIAFLEASGACLVRAAGNDDSLTALAKKNALALGTGHAFIIFMSNGFPINVLNSLKMVPEVFHLLRHREPGAGGRRQVRARQGHHGRD